MNGEGIPFLRFVRQKIESQPLSVISASLRIVERPLKSMMSLKRIARKNDDKRAFWSARDQVFPRLKVTPSDVSLHEHAACFEFSPSLVVSGSTALMIPSFVVVAS